MITKIELLEAIVARLDGIHETLTTKPCGCAKHAAYAAREAEQRARVPAALADVLTREGLL